MEEKTFFEHGDVKVTNARFITGAQTYAMSNVTSVKNHVEQPNRLFGIIMVLVGIVVALNSSFGGGVVIAAIGGVVLYLQKATYHVLLTTAGGESRALETRELDYITKVVNALNEAIVHRG